MTDGEPAADGLPAAIVHASPVPAGDRVRLRRRTVKVLVAGVALGSTGHIAAVTVAPIVATQLAGTSALSGVPGAAVVFGASGPRTVPQGSDDVLASGIFRNVSL